MKRALQPRAGFKWCSIMFAVSEAVPAELGTSFSVLIFIKTAIDFNCSVNRHAPTLLSASCVHPHSVSISFSRLSQFPVLLFVFIVLFNNNVVFPHFAKCADGCDRWGFG